MTDLVYIIGSGTIWEDNELRYSLRSVEKHLQNIGQVWIVGRVPKWIKNVRSIHCKDATQFPATNIATKLIGVAGKEDLSQEFLYIHDDHFFTKDFDADTFPTLYKGNLRDLNNKTDYQITVNNTIRALQDLGKGTLDFDTHTPIRFDKYKLLAVLQSYNWQIPHGYCIKSVYCNRLGLWGEQIEDGKFFRSKDYEQLQFWFSKHTIVSIDDMAMNNFLKKHLQKTYPNPSKYE